MDVEKLIQAAEDVLDAPAWHSRQSERNARKILAVRDHVRAEVIAQVREFISPYMEKTRFMTQYEDGLFTLADRLDSKLDELAWEERHG